MRYFAIVTHHSVVNTWWELKSCKSLAGAKRKATKEFGNGYVGHTLNLVEIEDTERTRALIDAGGWINDQPTHTRVIGTGKGWCSPS